MDAFGPSISQLLFHRATGELEPGTIEPITELVRSRGPHHHLGSVGQQVKGINLRCQLSVQHLKGVRSKCLANSYSTTPDPVCDATGAFPWCAYGVKAPSVSLESTPTDLRRMLCCCWRKAGGTMSDQ